MQDNAIGSAEIIDESITNAGLATNAVRSSEIAAGRVSGSGGLIAKDHIEDNSITRDDIQDGTIGFVDLAPEVNNNVIASSFSIVKRQIANMKEPQTIGIIVLPLSLHLPSGVKVFFDGKHGMNANLIECKLKGCRALFQAPKKVIALMKTDK